MKASCLTISRESVRLQATRVDQYKIMKARHGRRAADLNLGARGGGVVTTRPLERVEVDHTLCDVHLIDERTGGACLFQKVISILDAQLLPSIMRRL